MNNVNTELKIDPEFQDRVPPLTDEEFQQLEANILEDGVVLNALIVWNGVIVDGHNRYKIIQKHPELKYHIFQKEFADRFAAVAWICKHQLGRRNLTPEQKKYLIGKQYEAEKVSEAFKGNQYTSSGVSGSGQNVHHHSAEKTGERIARETGTNERYVRRAENFAKGVDAADEVVPGIRQEILSGSIKPTANAVAAVAKAQPEERRQMVEALREARGPSAKPRRSLKSKTQEIQKISEQMIEREHTANEVDMLGELESAVDSMISRCDICFAQFPALLGDDGYRTQVIRIMQEPKQYIQKIEGGTPR